MKYFVLTRSEFFNQTPYFELEEFNQKSRMMRDALKILTPGSKIDLLLPYAIF